MTEENVKRLGQKKSAELLRVSILFEAADMSMLVPSGAIVQDKTVLP